MSLTDLLKLFSLRPRFHKLYGKDICSTFTLQFYIILPPGERERAREGERVVGYNAEFSEHIMGALLEIITRDHHTSSALLLSATLQCVASRLTFPFSRFVLLNPDCRRYQYKH